MFYIYKIDRGGGGGDCGGGGGGSGQHIKNRKQRGAIIVCIRTLFLIH